MLPFHHNCTATSGGAALSLGSAQVPHRLRPCGSSANRKRPNRKHRERGGRGAAGCAASVANNNNNIDEFLFDIFFVSFFSPFSSSTSADRFDPAGSRLEDGWMDGNGLFAFKQHQLNGVAHYSGIQHPPLCGCIPISCGFIISKNKRN